MTGLVKLPVGAEAVLEDEDDTLEVLVTTDVMLTVAEVTIYDDGDRPVLLLEGVQLPGMHCEYQSLVTVQQSPESHTVGPVHPIPPPPVVSLYMSAGEELPYIGPKLFAGQQRPA
jgi:hypothetical protein